MHARCNHTLDVPLILPLGFSIKLNVQPLILEMSVVQRGAVLEGSCTDQNIQTAKIKLFTEVHIFLIGLLAH